MPLLKAFVEQFDRELTCLHALRSIVVGLSQTPDSVGRFLSSPLALVDQIALASPAVTQSEERSGPPRKTRADKGKPRERQASRVQSAENARVFTATIPTGPVVINPARLAEEKIQREQSRGAYAAVEPVQEDEDLDALSRSLAARWSAGTVHSHQ